MPAVTGFLPKRRARASIAPHPSKDSSRAARLPALAASLLGATAAKALPQQMGGEGKGSRWHSISRKIAERLSINRNLPGKTWMNANLQLALARVRRTEQHRAVAQLNA